MGLTGSFSAFLPGYYWIVILDLDGLRGTRTFLYLLHPCHSPSFFKPPNASSPSPQSAPFPRFRIFQGTPEFVALDEVRHRNGAV